MDTKQTTCAHCGRPREGNAGDYYHEKACEAAGLRRLHEKACEAAGLRRLLALAEAELEPKHKLVDSLRKRLEQAEYVGD